MKLLARPHMAAQSNTMPQAAACQPSAETMARQTHHLHLHQLLHALLYHSGGSSVIGGEGLEGCGASPCVLQVSLVGSLKGALQFLYLSLQADLQHIVLLAAPVAHITQSHLLPWERNGRHWSGKLPMLEGDTVAGHLLGWLS